MAARQGAQRGLGRGGDGVGARLRSPAGADLHDGAGAQTSEVVFEVLGGADGESVDLVGGLGAGLDRGAPRHRDHPDRLHGPVGALGHAHRGTVERGPGRGLGVDGVGLAPPAAHLAVGSVDLDYGDACGAEMAGEPGAVGAGALHPDAGQRPERAHPAQHLLIAACVGVEAGGAQQPRRGVYDRGDMGVFVGVDPAEDLGPVRCHNGDASCWSSDVWGTTGRDGGQNTHGVGFQSSYKVTSARPVGARPAAGTGRQIIGKTPEGSVRSWVRPAPATGPNQYEC